MRFLFNLVKMMRRKFRNKAIVALIVCLVLIILNTRNQGQILDQLEGLVDTYPKHLDHNYSFVPFENNKWLFNQNILQFSTVYTVLDNDKILVESLVLSLSNDLDNHKSKIRCGISSDLTDLSLFRPYEIVRLVDVLFHVKCKVRLQANWTSRTLIYSSVIDIRDTLRSVINTQLAKFYSSRVEKVKSVYECSGTIRKVNEQLYQSTLTWIKMLKRAGYARVKLISTDFKNNSFLNKLQASSPDFVDIEEYEMNVSVICASMARSMPDRALCERTYKHRFELNWNGDNYVHEMTIFHTCFLHAKYQYEYIAMMDPDEFVLPRSVNNKPRELTCGGTQRTTRSYNIYSYLEDLIKVLRIDRSKLGYFYFDNYLFLPRFDEMIKRVNRLNHVELNLANPLNQADKIYLSELDRLYNISSVCLSSRVSGVERKWKRIFTTRVHKPPGKSIFKTDSIVSVLHHYAHYTKPGKIRVNVPSKYGFLSHIRDLDYGEWEKSFESIQEWMIDLEYAIFLVNMFASPYPSGT